MASVLWRDVGVEPLLEELSGEVKKKTRSFNTNKLLKQYKNYS
jgi:hypothetical protein